MLPGNKLDQQQTAKPDSKYLAVLRRLSMWLRERPGQRQTAKLDTKHFERIQPPRPPAGSLPGVMQANKEVTGPTAAMMGSVASRLGANLHVKGEVTGSEDLVIEGTFEGLVQLDEGNVTIAKAAKVTADIVAAEIVVFGDVKGNVRAKKRVTIKTDGSVTGDLTTPEILIDDGALFRGSVEIDKGVEKEAQQSALSELASTSSPPKAAA
jgi:cytoskeletal protein CcmA (bactofilin family)